MDKLFDVMDEILVRYNEGVKPKEIAKELDMQWSRVRHYIAVIKNVDESVLNLAFSYRKKAPFTVGWFMNSGIMKLESHQQKEIIERIGADVGRMTTYRMNAIVRDVTGHTVIKDKPKIMYPEQEYLKLQADGVDYYMDLSDRADTFFMGSNRTARIRISELARLRGENPERLKGYVQGYRDHAKRKRKDIAGARKAKEYAREIRDINRRGGMIKTIATRGEWDAYRQGIEDIVKMMK